MTLPAGDATLAFGLVPDFLDEALVRLDAELDHDVDQEIKRLLMSSRASSRPPGFCFTSSTNCSKARSALAACMLVIEPGWPELTLRK